jgi:hypothetical protein
MYTDLETAREFIRQQVGIYQLLGITSMTEKQRARIARGEAIAEERKWRAEALMDGAACHEGPPPHQRTGRMRVLDLNTGEIQPSVSA